MYIARICHFTLPTLHLRNEVRERARAITQANRALAEAQAEGINRIMEESKRTVVDMIYVAESDFLPASVYVQHRKLH